MQKPTLAEQLSQVAETAAASKRLPGPRNQCGPVYGPGNLDDWQAVENLRLQSSWGIAQEHVDKILGITEPLANDAFRYHWRRKCSCWPRSERRP